MCPSPAAAGGGIPSPVAEGRGGQPESSAFTGPCATCLGVAHEEEETQEAQENRTSVTTCISKARFECIRLTAAKLCCEESRGQRRRREEDEVCLSPAAEEEAA